MKSKISTDLSKINQSKTTIPMSQYSKLKEEIKQVKYPTYAFSEAEKLSNKINTFKEQAVRNKLAAELSALNSYRKVRGDGNCFFRALAFSYISGVGIPSYYNCFEYIDQIQLDCCYPDSIPKMFKKFYDHKFLENVLKQSWQQILTKCLKESNNIKNKAMLKLFDQNPFLDFIIVLYFRAVCLKALSKFQGQFVDYMTGGEEASIREYSEETEGISIKLCSKILNITIFVYQVRKDQVHSYHYDTSKINNGNIHPSIALLFFENHYDILQNNPNIEAQKSVLKKKSTYYDQVNENLVNGVCEQCNTKDYVYDISKLCIKCHEASLATLNQFKKQKFVKANCQQCKRFREDVSSSFGLCTDCINYQNRMTTMKRCSICNRLAQLNEETLMCQPCLVNQQVLMNHMQSNKKINEKPQRIERPVKPENDATGFVLRSGMKLEGSKIRDNDSEYHQHTCKKCNAMILSSTLKNGFCKNCQ